METITRRTIFLVVLFFVGIYFGVLISALGENDPFKILKTITPLFSVLVAILGVFVGWIEYQEQRVMEVGFQSDFAKKVYGKRLEFYESFLEIIGEMEVYLIRYGSPNDGNRKGYIELLKKMHETKMRLGVWLSEREGSVVEKILQPHFKLNAASWLAESLSGSGGSIDEERRKAAIDEEYELMEKLFHDADGYSKFRDDLKDAVGINDIVYMQEYILSESRKVVKK